MTTRAGRPAHRRVAKDHRPLDPGLSRRRVRGLGPEWSASASRRPSKSLLDLAEALKREVPRRTAAQVAQIIRTARGRRARLRAHAAAALRPPRAATPAPTDRHRRPSAASRRPPRATCGPATPCTARAIAGRKTYLFAFIDDHSRALVGYRWGLSEDTVRLEAALRAARRVHGACPRGATWTTAAPWSPASCCGPWPASASRLVHTRPGQPQGRGKIERFFATVRVQFLVEVEARPPDDLAELNRLFSAWVETVYHRRVHSETGEAPIDRLLGRRSTGAARPRRAARGVLVVRDPHGDQDSDRLVARQRLRGRRRTRSGSQGGASSSIPSTSTSVEIRFQGRSMGTGVPVVIGRHTHPKARPEAAPPPVTDRHRLPRLLAERREAELAQAIALSTSSSLSPGDPLAPHQADTSPRRTSHDASTA